MSIASEPQSEHTAPGDVNTDPAAAPVLPQVRQKGRTIRFQITLVAGTVVLPMLLGLGILAYSVGQMQNATLAVKSAYETIDLGHRLVRQFAEIQMAVHAYAYSGQAIFMDAYQQGRRDWSQAEAAASGSIAQDEARAKHFLAIEEDVDEFFNGWEERLNTLTPGANDPETLQRINEDQGHVRRISASIGEFVRDEEAAIRQRLDDEDRARNQVYISAIAGSAGSILLLAVFATMLGEAIARPIHNVAEAARRLGEGEWENRATPQGGRETRTLAVTFNNMADALQQARTALDARNKELWDLSSRLTTVNEDLVDRQREQEDFLYVLSHDLRAPLINIQGFTKRLQTAMTAMEGALAEEQTVPPEATKQLARMHESLKFVNAGTSKIDQLIARLLDVARLTTRPNKHQWVDMKSLATDALSACRFQMEERGIEASIGDLPKVHADPVQINQVLTNLVDNAIKYMGDRPVKRISITCVPQGDRYRFGVEDTGPGISPKDKEKVFRMFARLAPNASQGEGIGLAAVRAIVNRHGGRIWVESTVGVGSAFYFTLPKTSGSASSPAEQAVPMNVPPATRKETAGDARALG